MGRKSILIISLFLISTLSIFAQSGASFEFVENKGQWEKEITYKGEMYNGAFFLEKTGFTVLLHNEKELQQLMESHHSGEADKRIRRPDRNSPSNSKNPAQTQVSSRSFTLHSHSYTVSFVNPGNGLEIIPDKPLEGYNNYFIGNDPSKWASNVKIYQALLYKNVYPNIDFRYYSENGKLKYDIIVHPGGDLSRVALKYNGVDKLSIRNRELVIKTSVGDVRELSPNSFQFDKVTGRKNVECRYVITDGNIVRFGVENYSKEATLIIDPSLIFSSFTGSKADQYGFTATPGPDGSFYSGGIVFGQGFPTTPGAFQTVFAGGGAKRENDIGIMKFSANGSQRLYATYLGGEQGTEYPHSLFCDPQGNLVVMGRSYSPDYPGTTINPGGSSPPGADIIVTKLNANGTAIIGSLKIGGSGPDGVNIGDMQEQTQSDVANSLIRYYGDDSRSEVVLDGSNNIYVAAQTQSTNFPVIGGFQSKSGGGQDGVIMKINPNCTSLIWSSYLGGSKNDGAFVLALNPTDGNIYVAGGTESSNFPGNKSGTIGGSLAGQIDGFVSIIANNGSSILKSTFLGTADIDILYGIQFDKLGFPYIMGVSRGNWPVINAVYKVAGTAQFVAKLQPDLSKFLYSTTFGSGRVPNMSPVAFLVDRCENVYISGWGGWIDTNSDPFKNSGVAGMPVTSDAIKSVTDNKDFYFIVIKKDAASLLYGSFFGQNGGEGEHVDGGTSRYDAQGVIYQAICANCFGKAIFPTTPGVVGPVNGTGGSACNLAAVKIAFNFAGVAAGPRAYFNGVADTAGCVPFTVTLRDTIRNATSYEWQFNDGTPDTTTTSTELVHTFSKVGVFRVRLIAIDSSTCNIRDTAYLNIKVSADKAFLNFNAVKQPPCQSLSYQFNNLSVAPTTKPFGGLSFTWDFGDGTPRIAAGSGAVVHSFSAPGAYNVRLILTDTNYCNAPDSQTLMLRVSPLVKAQFETPASGCAPYDAVFTNTSLAGKDFLWDFGDGTTSTEVNPIHLYPNTGTYRIKLVAIDPETCNGRDETEFILTVSDKPTANFNTTPIPPQENKPTIFHNLSSGGIRYKWLFGDGDSTVTTSMDTVLHQYNATGAYNACLIVYNEAGCTDTACNVVEAHIIPLLDVPNAFTPGRFGRNAVIKVQGFGIAKMDWKIYNRWGQLVFESHDPKIGWDGTFNGKVQPLDVYAYTLEVEFTDGTKTRKTGDITLIK